MCGRDWIYGRTICFSSERRICARFSAGPLVSDTGTRESWARDSSPPPALSNWIYAKQSRHQIGRVPGSGHSSFFSVHDRSTVIFRPNLDKLRNQLFSGLEAQGFDTRELEEVFEGLVERYANGILPFRRKLYLNAEFDAPD